MVENNAEANDNRLQVSDPSKVSSSGTNEAMPEGRTVAKQQQINPTSHFTNDLGLDSLDTVEVVMAIEEVCLAERATGRLLTLSQEFSVEIPDKEADGILSSKCLSLNDPVPLAHSEQLTRLSTTSWLSLTVRPSAGGRGQFGR